MWSQGPGTSERGHHIMLPGTLDGNMTLGEVHSMSPIAGYHSLVSSLIPPREEPTDHLKFLIFMVIRLFMKDPSLSGDTQPPFLTAFQTRNVGASLYFPLSLCLVNHWDTGCCFLYFSQICLFLSTSALVQVLIHSPGHTNRLICSWHGSTGPCPWLQYWSMPVTVMPWVLSRGPLHGPATERSAWPRRGSGPGSTALAFFSSDWAMTCCYMILVSPLFFLLWTYINFLN